MSPIALGIASEAPVSSLQQLKARVALSPGQSFSQFHVTSPRPRAVNASGLEVTLSDGSIMLDAASGGAAVASIGMGSQEVVTAMTAQTSKVGYVYHQALGNGPAEDLAEWLVARSEGALESAAFLSSGSEAMEAVIKLCRQYWVEKGEPNRRYIIARFPSYHGNTLGALSIGNIPPRRAIYEPFFSDVSHHVTSPNYRRSHEPGETEEAYSARLAIELEDKILELGPENVMAFVVEPVVGSALGVMPPPKGYFPAVDAVVKKYGLLFAMDEVMSGSGRVGELFAHQAVCEGVKPDILAMAKGLGGGYVPISAVMVNKRVATVIRQAGLWKNSHTYQNHPMCCAAALKVLQIIERDGLLANVKQRGEELRCALRLRLSEIDRVLDVRGAGLFVGIELEGSPDANPRLAAQVSDRCFANGVLVLGISGSVDGHIGESIILAPAYTISSQQVEDIADKVCLSIKEVLSAA